RALLSVDLRDRVERRVAGEEGNRRVQAAAGEQQEREAGPGLLVVNAHAALVVERAGASAARLQRKHARDGGGCRGRRAGGQQCASLRVHVTSSSGLDRTVAAVGAAESPGRRGGVVDGIDVAGRFRETSQRHVVVNALVL